MSDAPVKNKRNRKPSQRLETAADKIVFEGKTVHDSFIEAGFASSTAKSNCYNKQVNARLLELIEERRARLRKRAIITKEEVIGSLAEIATSSLADVLPDDSFLRKAKELGTDHLIKKVKRIIHKDGGETYEYEMYSRLEAINQVSEILGLKKQAAVNPTDLELAKKTLDSLRKTHGKESKFEESQQLSDRQIFKFAIKPSFPELRAEQLQITEEEGLKGEEEKNPAL